jgi:peptidoglycan/LPS O-acetylase OafA/YrhL
MVVLLHLTGILASAKYFGLAGADAPFVFGKAGVEFFFVLSGFIITFIHWHDFGSPRRLTDYVGKRALRIYPSYWAIFGIVYVVAAITLGPSVTLTPAVLARTLLLIPQASSDPIIGTFSPVLVVAWSLQYEVMFYILMACFVVNVPLGVMVALALLSNLIGCRTGLCIAPAPYLQTDFLLLFGLGALSAIMCRKWTHLRFPRILAAVGFAAFLITALWNDMTGIRLTLAYGAASAIIIVGLVKAEDAGRLRIASEWPVQMGNASYALYLIHFPLISVLSKVAVRIGLHGLLGALVAAPIMVGLCLLSAIGFYRFVEKPLMRVVDKQFYGLKAAPVGS